MIPTNHILQRTFKIKNEESTATCFTIDVENRQYIITAKHCVENVNSQTTLQIMHKKEWKNLEVKLVGHSKGDIDISVLATDYPISPSHPLHVSQTGLTLAQDVYFLGFPYGIGSEVPINNGFPIPFVKRAIISQFDKNFIMLDGHNNRGFSGGPVVWKSNNIMTVVGVIRGYKLEYLAVYENKEQNGSPLGYCESNTGIIVAYNIEHALDLIQQNPIGAFLEE